jgi:hypothetical protein
MCVTLLEWYHNLVQAYERNMLLSHARYSPHGVRYHTQESGMD